MRVGGQLLVAPGCHAFKVRRELGFFPHRQFVRGADHEFEGEDDERADEHAAHGAKDEAEQAVEEAEAGRFQHLRDEEVDDADEEQHADEDAAKGRDVGNVAVRQEFDDVGFGDGLGEYPGGVERDAPGDEREDFFEEAAHQADERRDDERAAEGDVYPVEGFEVHGEVLLREGCGLGVSG